MSECEICDTTGYHQIKLRYGQCLFTLTTLNIYMFIPLFSLALYVLTMLQNLALYTIAFLSQANLQLG